MVHYGTWSTGQYQLTQNTLCGIDVVHGGYVAEPRDYFRVLGLGPYSATIIVFSCLSESIRGPQFLSVNPLIYLPNILDKFY